MPWLLLYDLVDDYVERRAPLVTEVGVAVRAFPAFL